MAGINPNMTASELMDQFVPDLIESKLAGIGFQALSDVIQICIHGAGEWIAHIADGKPRVAAGSHDAPLIIAHVGTDAVESGILRAATTIDDVDAIDVSLPAGLIAKLLTQELANQVRANVRGTIKFAVTTDSGDEQSALVGFGGIDPDSPTCVVATTENELLDIVEGEMTPQQAFMAGKIRFEGDMSPAMTLGMIAVPLLIPALQFVKKYMRDR